MPAHPTSRTAEAQPLPQPASARTARRLTRTALASVLSVATIAGAAAAAQPAVAGTMGDTGAARSAAEEGAGYAPAVIHFGQATPGIEGRDAWRPRLAQLQALGFTNVEEVWTFSPAMNRDIPVLLIRPQDPAKRANAPTLYLLNGADGGEGRANWLMQTDLVQYYGGNTDPAKGPVTEGIGANVVIPMAGRFSYYTDWVNPAPSLGGVQKWETYMTRELPQAIEPALGANGRRAIAGMSMSATSSLMYAEHHPGFYNAVGSFSGCASTTSGMAPLFVDLTLDRGKATVEQMWGGHNTPAAQRDDALLGAPKLAGQRNIYVSNGTGIAGEHDWPTSPRLNGNLSASGVVIVEGGTIEAATNTCTLEFAWRTQSLGIPVTFNFRPTGTHQWGYWQDDLRAFRPVLMAGLHG